METLLESIGLIILGIAIENWKTVLRWLHIIAKAPNIKTYTDEQIGTIINKMRDYIATSEAPIKNWQLIENIKEELKKL